MLKTLIAAFFVFTVVSGTSIGVADDEAKEEGRRGWGILGGGRSSRSRSDSDRYRPRPPISNFQLNDLLPFDNDLFQIIQNNPQSRSSERSSNRDSSSGEGLRPTTSNSNSRQSFSVQRSSRSSRRPNRRPFGGLDLGLVQNIKDVLFGWQRNIDAAIAEIDEEIEAML